MMKMKMVNKATSSAGAALTASQFENRVKFLSGTRCPDERRLPQPRVEYDSASKVSIETATASIAFTNIDGDRKSYSAQHPLSTAVASLPSA
jgi:hypothetical protein